MAVSLERFALKTSFGRQGLIHKVGLVGCGATGQELARLISQAGIELTFVERTEEKVQNALDAISKQLDDLINGWGLTKGDKRVILSRIKGVTDLAELKSCDFIIEAISSENPLSDRAKLFADIEAVVPQTTVISSGISAWMMSEITTSMKHPERTVAMNFFAGPANVGIVEVVCAMQTNPETYELACRLVKMLGKEPVTVQEAPGSISTRLIVALINEACASFTEGVGTIEQIDAIMRGGYGMQHGPFELADKLGLEKVLKYMDHLYEEYGRNQFKATPLLKRLVKTGQLGTRTGKGFYQYDADGKKTGMNLILTTISNQ